MESSHGPAIAGGAAAYAVIVLAWLLPPDHQMPPEVQAAVAGLITAGVGYFPSLVSLFRKTPEVKPNA